MSRLRRFAGCALAIAAAIGLEAGTAAAQDTGTIRGRVQEASTARPLSGA